MSAKLTMTNFDPIRLELFKNIFSSIAEEMGVALCRSAFSANIKERRDFSCAIFDANAKMIAQAAHIPVHLGSMPLSVKSAIDHFADQPFSNGDMILLNDPFRGGTHLPDLTVVMPIFTDVKNGSPDFFVANRAHHADVGGMSPGSMPLSTSIVQEGIRIPPIKIAKNGEIRTDLLDLILANVRTPDERLGDLTAQISANRIGEKRLIEIVEKYGNSEVQKQSADLQNYSSRIMRSILREVPDGRYCFADHLDNDGITDRKIKINVCIKIGNETAIVDFSGTDRQVEGSVNAIFAITLSAVFYVFRCLAHLDLPTNSGCLEPIEVIADRGSVVNAEFPSAVAAGNVETSQRIVDVLLGALSKACPDRVPAASSGTMNNLTIGNKNFAYYETIGGGMGARPHCDGISAVHTHMTNTLNTPIEALELIYPLRIVRYGIRSNSGGDGKFRGGDGFVRSFRLLESAQVTIISDRRVKNPYGLHGGEDGEIGENLLLRKGRIENLGGKVSIDGQIGDVIEIRTPGGGGFGDEEGASRY